MSIRLEVPPDGFSAFKARYKGPPPPADLGDCTSIDQLPLVLDAEEVAELLGVSSSTVYEAARDGRIPCLRFGRRIRFPRERIRQLLAGECSAHSPIPGL